MALHEALRENFRGFELRGFLVRSPNAQAVLFEQIDDAEGQRIVGANDREVRAHLAREGEQPGQVLGGDVDAFDRLAGFCDALVGDAGIPRRAPHLRDARRLRQLPDERMLPPARTYDQ